MRFLAPILGLVLLLPVDASKAELSFKSNEVPKTSELRKEISFETANKEIRDRVLKLIPLGTSEEDAKLLFQKHMPRKAQKCFNEGGGVSDPLPENLRDKPYVCYRLLSELNLSHVGSQWLDVLFFFENGKLAEVYIARGSVVF